MLQVWRRGAALGDLLVRVRNREPHDSNDPCCAAVPWTPVICLNPPVSFPYDGNRGLIRVMWNCRLRRPAFPFGNDESADPQVPWIPEPEESADGSAAGRSLPPATRYAWSAVHGEAGVEADLLLHGEGQLQESEGFELARTLQGTGVDGIEAAGLH